MSRPKTRFVAVVLAAQHRCGPRRRHGPELTPEVDEHGEQRAEVHGHVERQALVRPAEEMRNQHQVTGAGDGKELREPLDDG